MVRSAALPSLSLSAYVAVLPVSAPCLGWLRTYINATPRHPPSLPLSTPSISRRLRRGRRGSRGQQVNHLPSFNTDGAIDRSVKRRLLRDALTLVNAREKDKVGGRPAGWSVGLAGGPRPPCPPSPRRA